LSGGYSSFRYAVILQVVTKMAHKLLDIHVDQNKEAKNQHGNSNGAKGHQTQEWIVHDVCQGLSENSGNTSRGLRPQGSPDLIISRAER